MGDMGETYRDFRALKNERKESRRADNLKFLQDSGIEWRWIDASGDHLLIEGRIDYYPGSTFWRDRLTGRHGHAMLKKMEAAQ